MSESRFYCVGKVTTAHGIKGELFVHLFAKTADWLPQFKTLILSLEKEGTDFKEFPVEKAREHKHGLIVKPIGIDDRNRAEELEKHFMQIPLEWLKSKPGEEYYLIELINFQVVDKNQKLIGEVVDFSSNGVQDLLVIKNKKREFQVPFVEQYVVEINQSEKVLIMDIPPGLDELP